MRFLEILLGILLFPFMLILGLVIGVIKCYKLYHAACMSVSRDDYLWNIIRNAAAQNAALDI